MHGIVVMQNNFNVLEFNPIIIRLYSNTLSDLSLCIYQVLLIESFKRNN